MFKQVRLTLFPNLQTEKFGDNASGAAAQALKYPLSGLSLSRQNRFDQGGHEGRDAYILHMDPDHRVLVHRWKLHSRKSGKTPRRSFNGKEDF